LFIITFIFYLM